MTVVTKLNITAKEVDKLINNVINNLVNIKDDSGKYLYTLENGRLLDTKGWLTGWEWTQGVGLYGMWIYYETTNDSRIMDLIKHWFDVQVFEPKEGVPKNVNTMSVFLTLAYMYESQPNGKYLPYLDTWAEWCMYDLERTEGGGFQHTTFIHDNYQQLWDDTLMMAVMPLAKIGLLLNRPQYIEESKRQMLLHTKYLVDTKTGLWYHGWTFEGNHAFSKALWARGNAWITIVIPDFIELLDLPPGDGVREFLVETLDTQVAKLEALQEHKTGLWHTLLDDPSSYVESSATAGFAYGILKGVRKRYLDKKYLPCGIKAIKGVVDQIDNSGELLNTSFGTGMGNNLQFYKDIPLTSMPYGQAMAIMALVEYSKLYL